MSELPWMCRIFGIDCPPPPEPIHVDGVRTPPLMPGPDQVSAGLVDYVAQLDALGREPTGAELGELQRMLADEGFPAAALLVAEQMERELARFGSSQAELNALYHQQAHLHRLIADDLSRLAGFQVQNIDEF